GGGDGEVRRGVGVDERVHAVGAGDVAEAADVAVIDAGIAFVGGDDVGLAAEGVGGDFVRHGHAFDDLVDVDGVAGVGGIDGLGDGAEFGDVGPLGGWEVEDGEGVGFLKRHVNFVAGDGGVFRFDDVDIGGIGVGIVGVGEVGDGADEGAGGA